ncbi:ARM repeat-containing protein [Patellaria atrata CBS 101060]|uniref:ARM repeat-containing protein n=1 Tax=Patellaria atrata CBS 101060 TaxID=1346257 RepID=A0A9P4VSP9_9PEZI|nr:ARM repeat-containing protein [Patellaria atrata CBS 101060]
MEEQLVRLLAETQTAEEGVRKQAEAQLQQHHSNPDFPIALASVGSHESVPINIRQSALLTLRKFISTAWSPQFDEYTGQVNISDENKHRLRHMLLDLATNGRQERKIETAAGYVVSKIATADYPDEWPDLLQTLLQIIPIGNDAQIHGTLKVLGELVEEALGDEQFLAVARSMVKIIYDVAVNDSKPPILRALALSVFRGCFDMLEMFLEDHKAAVKAFADETISGWIPFFLEILKSKLPDPPSEDEDMRNTVASSTYRGLVALKLQTVKVLFRIRCVFPSLLQPHAPILFSSTWEELTALEKAYREMYIEDERQGRLEDADGLPYTLDFLVLEDLDFMQTCLRAPPVRKELESQLSSQNGPENWVYQFTQLAIAYAKITTEEEGLWNIDVNVFLSEETSVTANYTPRTACGDLLIKLGEWLNTATVEALLAYTRSLYSTNQGWKEKEAALFVLNAMLGDYQDREKNINADAANGFVDFIRYAMQQPEEFLRARGYLVAGNLVEVSGDVLQLVAGSFMEATLQAMVRDESDVVKVSCIRALQCYLSALPPSITKPMQSAVISGLSEYISGQDLNELTDGDDLMVTIVETLRDAILLDPRICLTGSGLDLLFTLANHGARTFQITIIVTEAFELITRLLSETGNDAYVQLCTKVLPSLTGAFDVGALTEENALTNLAAELLAVFTQHGSTPLPQGFVQTVMPKLNRMLLGSNDDELLKAATVTVKNIVEHDAPQIFNWHDETGKGGLEVILVIIDRLLGTNIDDNAASEVGGLAAEFVEKAGSERLGPYLMQLLRAVAVRLQTAEHAPLIQSLILVFARLCLVSANDVVEFLAQVQIGQESGLQVVLTKWLENSISFAGYEEIRQSVVALTKIYELEDPRLDSITAKGELIVSESTRIMTRSRARQNPPQYTIIPMRLKILKVLVEELLVTSQPSQRTLDAAAELADEAGSDDGDWEDEPGDLDLSNPAVKNELMGYVNEGPEAYSHKWSDDETQTFLIGWFRGLGTRPDFEAVFESLTENEKHKLRTMDR